MPTEKLVVEVTADQAMEELGVKSRQAVAYMIRTGKLPGARKLQPGKPGSPWLIPVTSVEALKKKKNKRAQAKAA